MTYVKKTDYKLNTYIVFVIRISYLSQYVVLKCKVKV